MITGAFAIDILVECSSDPVKLRRLPDGTGMSFPIGFGSNYCKRIPLDRFVRDRVSNDPTIKMIEFTRLLRFLTLNETVSDGLQTMDSFHKDQPARSVFGCQCFYALLASSLLSI